MTITVENYIKSAFREFLQESDMTVIDEYETLSLGQVRINYLTHWNKFIEWLKEI